MKSPNDEQEKLDKALLSQPWAKAVLAIPSCGLAQDEGRLPVDALVKAAKAAGKGVKADGLPY